MKISREEKEKIVRCMKNEKAMKYIHETKDQREKRKCREYCENYNRHNIVKIVNGMTGAIHKNQPYFYEKNGDEWEKVNIIFRKNLKHKWEEKDRKHKKYERNELCILYEDGMIKVLNAVIEQHEIETYDREEADKHEEFTMMRLPKYKMRFEVEKMRNFDNLSQVIEMEGEEITKEDLLQAILQKSINIYEVK